MRNSGETPRNLDLIPKFLGEPNLDLIPKFLGEPLKDLLVTIHGGGNYWFSTLLIDEDAMAETVRSDRSTLFSVEEVQEQSNRDIRGS